MSQSAQAAKVAAPKTAISPTRSENFPDWYQEVIKAAGLAENSPVRGCMVIKPYGYAIWEYIQRALDDKIKAEGVQNAYFPLLIPLVLSVGKPNTLMNFCQRMCPSLRTIALRKENMVGLFSGRFAIGRTPDYSSNIGNDHRRFHVQLDLVLS